MTGQDARTGGFRLPVALSAIRAGFATLQLLAPALLADRVMPEPLDKRARLIGRVLGARQLGQALVSGRSPTVAVLALGCEVDLLHSASMLAVGVVDRRRRPAAIASALVAASFAVAGALAARATSHQPPPTPVSGTLWARRDEWAARLAAVLVPGSPTGHGAARGAMQQRRP